MNQQMNIGQFVAAEIVILLVIESTEKIIMNMDNVYDVFTSLEKIGQLTELELDDNQAKPDYSMVLQKPLDIELQQIDFSYTEGGDLILNQFSYHFQSGKKYAISGENGSGKSTLLHIIAGIQKTTKGKILVNGFPFSQYNRTQLYDMMGNGLREETIFEGTLLENISLGRNIDQLYINQIIDQLQLKS